MTTLDALLDSIFEGNPTTLYADFAAWAQESRRFRAFATEHRTKIRAKLRHAHGEGGMQDLRAEIETAALLLREKRFTLEYENAAAKGRAGLHRDVQDAYAVQRRGAAHPGTNWTPRTPTHKGKLMAVLCDKVGQMPPGNINLLWLAADGV